MPRTAYTPVAESSDPASVELTSATKLQDELPQRNAEAFTVGKPRSKPVFEWIDFGALLCSLACLIASICVVTPKLSLAWRLGYDLQIVVIGFLLSIMNLCFKRIAPIIFPILEARWGRSSLQNYDAIIRNTLWLSQTNTPWRLVILTLIALPLGLSAAYKRFTGGHSSTTITSHYPGHYGLTIPPLGPYSTMNNSIYVMMDAYAPFMLASSNDSIQPPFAELPVAYGYNTLLLDNASAALLDLPMPDYISSIRQNLTSDESWEITASVNATVAKYDESTEMNRNNNIFWQSTFDDSWDRGNNGLTSFQMYDYEYDFGLVTGNVSLANGASCFLGPYNGSTIRIRFIRNVTESDSLSFRSAALMFNVRREQCAGSWQINRTDIALLSETAPNHYKIKVSFGGRMLLPSH